MERKPLALPPEFLHELACPPPPTYAQHEPGECGHCLHMRRAPGGLPVPAQLDHRTGRQAQKPLSANPPEVRALYAGLGFCMLSPPVPGRNLVSVFPTTHVSWTCQYQTPGAEPTAVEVRPRPR
jgi:hypothetical protein